MTIKGEEMYTIETSDCLSDVENGCLHPSNGGMFTASQAINALEQGYGGVMNGTSKGIGSFGVSHIKSENQWLRDKLKIN